MSTSYQAVQALKSPLPRTKLRVFSGTVPCPKPFFEMLLSCHVSSLVPLRGVLSEIVFT
jgi:hypothetical protein